MNELRLTKLCVGERLCCADDGIKNQKQEPKTKMSRSMVTQPTAARQLKSSGSHLLHRWDSGGQKFTTLPPLLPGLQQGPCSGSAAHALAPQNGNFLEVYTGTGKASSRMQDGSSSPSLLRFASGAGPHLMFFASLRAQGQHCCPGEKQAETWMV